MLSAFAVYSSKPQTSNKLSKKKLHRKGTKQKRPIIKAKIDETPKLHELTKALKKQCKVKRGKIKNAKSQKIEKQEQNLVGSDVYEGNSTSSPLPPVSSNKLAPPRKKRRISKSKPSQIANGVNEIDDVLKKPVDLLNYLLAPVRISEFFNMYWENKPLHISRNTDDYFKNILTSKQIDTILRENLLYYTKNVDVVTYENGERQTHNPEGRAIPANVWDYYMNGCSVRIMNPHTYNSKVRDLLSTLQEYFGTMVGVNVYLTPPGSQGFAPHYDDIEAFVLQLEGHKNWKLYSPRNDNEVLPRYSSPNLPRNNLQQPIKELTLQAGDLLYFPRGYIHEASTDSDAHSLHITVSVYQNTAYVDLLEKLLPQALKAASERDVNFRKGLPLNYLKHVGVVNSDKTTPERKEIFGKVKSLVSKLVDYASLDLAADQLGRKFMYEALPPLLSASERRRSCKEDGDRIENGIVSNIASFNPDTKVRLARFHSQRLVTEDSGVKLYYCTENANVYHGEDEQFLELDNTLIETVRALQNNYPQYISVEKLPGNDEVKKIQTISDFWERGLIITREPLDIEDE